MLQGFVMPWYFYTHFYVCDVARGGEGMVKVVVLEDLDDRGPHSFFQHFQYLQRFLHIIFTHKNRALAYKNLQLKAL